MIIMKKISICVLHGLLLTALTLFWQYYGFFTSEDKLELKWAELIRRSFFHADPKPLHSIAFVDISGARTLVPNENGFGTTMITDRAKMAAFIHGLDKGNAGYKYILCDVLFTDSSKDDDSLRKAFSQAKNIVVAAEINEDRTIIKPRFGIHYGVVSYSAEDETFLKLKMYYKDTLLSLPLAMYSELYKPSIDKTWFLHINDEFFLNTQTVLWRIRPFDWEKSSHFPLYPLELMANLPPSSDAFKDLFGNKIIVIGDFKTDMHHTVIGDMPGAVILLNAYLSLVNKDNRISTGWFVYLIGAFTLMSWLSFYYQVNIRRKMASFFSKYDSLKYLKRFIGYASGLYLIALGSYLLFHVFISILVLALYLSFLNNAFIKKILATS